MKLLLNRETLLKPLQTIGNIVERRPTLAILSNILIQIKDNKLTLTGTDLEVEIITTFDIDSAENDEITLPGRKFIDICRALPAEAEIEVTTDSERAVIRSGRSRFTLSTLPATEFPNLDPITSPLEFSLTQKDLKRLIEKTQFCMAQQDVRYYLNGLLLEITPEKITAVATDGHRLALSEISGSFPVTENRQIIIPRKGVTELARLLEDTDGSVQIRLSENHIKIDLDGLSFTSKLIDGKFPDYQQVIPKDANNNIICLREPLRQAFARASVLSNEKYRGIRLQFSDNSLKATVHNPEQEEAEENIEINYQGDEMEIGFNVAYFLEALSVIDEENVELHLTDTNHSCLVQGQGDIYSRYVIMPMRL
jgi:DNA polymerase-3 subunit beta